LDLFVSEGGSVLSARVLNGHPILQKSAIDAAKKWLYKPYTQNGKPMAFETTTSITFSLN
jgi:TonB family protein